MCLAGFPGDLVYKEDLETLNLDSTLPVQILPSLMLSTFGRNNGPNEVLIFHRTFFSLLSTQKLAGNPLRARLMFTVEQAAQCKILGGTIHTIVKSV